MKLCTGTCNWIGVHWVVRPCYFGVWFCLFAMNNIYTLRNHELFYYYFVCICVCIYVCMNVHGVCVWEGGGLHVPSCTCGEDNFMESFLFFHFYVGSGDEPRSQGLCGSALICWVIWPARIFFSSQIESWCGGLCFNPTSLPISTSPLTLGSPKFTLWIVLLLVRLLYMESYHPFTKPYSMHFLSVFRSIKYYSVFLFFL